MAGQEQIVKQKPPARPRPAEQDLRTPSGKPMKF